ncbi:hypothetical protein GOFOIKOB_5188 [Methylobacterium tardum]|uniref:Uncharacterized protein n=1 Tax=Methylobacterium tardum TaxID=374432 RepID=A0AA37WT13_9HYPH|nr:hypothetical protein [Methylobacterium tardum]URD38106.1 hypothetical protein M6G65_06410 [Methylobacterium tardum]GJE52120.1 hypothetical protein GOFOIKOB_5188 [Methylobacterium tardum]GLS71679.1 hypothetical protein GCM10007890_36920 [Methylobacterium tardum]
MSVIFAITQSHLADPRADLDRQVAEAEERCERQGRFVFELGAGTSPRDYAEHVLRVMEQTLSISRANRALIQQLGTGSP